MSQASTPRHSRLIAIGDIHGHDHALAALLDWIQPQRDDTLVTLGDHVNRGPDSRGVIERLIRLDQSCNLVSLLGNHEEVMLDARRDAAAEQRWRDQGGWETLYSYSDSGTIDAIPDSHWQFLADCRPYHETDDFLFFHANYRWDLSPGNQPTSLLRWRSIEEAPPKAHFSGKVAIVGHQPGPIRDLGFYRCIDTGCGFGGLLAAMEVRTGHCWQITEGGERATADNATASDASVSQPPPA